MYTETDNYLEYAANIICWLIFCAFLGYLSAQIIAWYGRGMQFVTVRPSDRNYPLQRSINRSKTSTRESHAVGESIEYGVFRDMRWEIVKV